MIHISHIHKDSRERLNNRDKKRLDTLIESEESDTEEVKEDQPLCP
jgi:hypothetical protein